MTYEALVGARIETETLMEVQQSAHPLEQRYQVHLQFPPRMKECDCRLAKWREC